MPTKTAKNKRILMIGPFPDPLMGMSVSNKVLFDALPIGVTAFDRKGDRIWGNSEGERLDGELGERDGVDGEA